MAKGQLLFLRGEGKVPSSLKTEEVRRTENVDIRFIYAQDKL
jgi:hypothetical protein